MDNRLSVIVIGRNEEKTLGAVLARFKELGAQVDRDCQLVYVDSDSTDESVAIAQKFRSANPELDISILRLRGAVNAAIGRNVGVQQLDSRSKYVFFVDGDIVFDSDFVREAILVMERDPEAGSVSGSLVDSFRTPGSEPAVRPVAQSSDADTRLWHGGNFITRKAVVDEVGLFDIHLIRHQDIDYAFRIRQQGYRLRMLHTRMGIHHTVSYMSPARVLEHLRRGHYVYSGLLFRKYLFSRLCPDMLRSIAGTLFRLAMLGCAGASVFFPPVGLIALFGFVVILGRRSVRKGETLGSRALSFLAGLQFLVGLLKVRRGPTYEVEVIKPVQSVAESHTEHTGIPC